MNILSLFDYTGSWAAPFDSLGHDVHTFDIKTGQDVKEFCSEWFHDDSHHRLSEVDGFLLAPPCTHFTCAGAQYWPDKDEDGRTEEAVEIARQGLRAVEFWRPDFWALENPVGRIQKLIPVLGKYRLKFDPCDYAGWTQPSPDELAMLDELRARNGEGDFTFQEIELVKRTNAYTKATCLWGNFQLPEKKRIEPVKVCKAGSWLMKHGGTSEATKAARSVTPLGFAWAFAVAQQTAFWGDDETTRARRGVLYARSLEMEDQDEAYQEALNEFGDITPAAFFYEWKFNLECEIASGHRSALL